MEMAFAARKRSTCLRRQVGALLAVHDRPIAIGYNGSPHNFPHCTEETCNGETICRATVHAEMNCIAFCASEGIAVNGSDLYTTASPCNDCAKLLIAAHVTRVFFYDEYRDPAPIALLQDAGLSIYDLKYNRRYEPNRGYEEKR